MGKLTDARVVGASLYFLPAKMVAPLKVGDETPTEIVCARASITLVDDAGHTAEGWGETPLDAQSAWPSHISWRERAEALTAFATDLADLWSGVRTRGHALEIGHEFLTTVLPGWTDGFNQRRRRGREPMPWTAALLCCSPFDLALHDAYGRLQKRSTYATYNATFMNRDLAAYLQPASGSKVSFRGKAPSDFFTAEPRKKLPVWDFIGDADHLEKSSLVAGAKCLKIKLRGHDAEWDYQRLVSVGAMVGDAGVDWMAVDFNSAARDLQYVNELLDRLRDTRPRLYGMLLYLSQPFRFDPAGEPVDVHSVSARKPIFLGAGAQDWRQLRRGRELGWSGATLNASLTQTGALLGACWAKAHGMSVMVEDASTSTLARLPAFRLAAHAGTVMGIERGAIRFEEKMSGVADTNDLTGPGFGYPVEAIQRTLPAPAAQFLL